MEEQIKMIMADILELDPNTIDDSTGMDTVDAWDSLNHLNLCLALEQEFDLSFEVHEMEAMVSFYDIQAIIQEKM